MARTRLTDRQLQAAAALLHRGPNSQLFSALALWMASYVENHTDIVGGSAEDLTDSWHSAPALCCSAMPKPECQLFLDPCCGAGLGATAQD
ncbi:hypothetical protein GDO78_009607 [Eleutherodactylus coqui]|uniref:Uncharacterized protein n=1 Tax=Eleutherodactylus coqui TaxID=57060 RepID=A0A8J6FB15_ELECQ|nr:hypothetical protein GDO78_009607 [Eleutherodactylus coqui]